MGKHQACSYCSVPLAAGLERQRVILEVTGTSTANKGAELMLEAIRRRLGPAGVELAVTPWFGDYRDRARYGLRTKLEAGGWGRSRLAMALMPRAMRGPYGLAAESDIAAVLDASGFAFSDELPAERVERFAQDVRRWKRRGQRVILLPQALGPFEKPRHRAAFETVMRHADLIYARDRDSYEHVKILGGAEDRLRRAPDFTNLVPGAVPEDLRMGRPLACVVPNRRMVEMMDQEKAAEYPPFLARCIEALREMGLRPHLLLHDPSGDAALTGSIQKNLEEPVPVLREEDPVRLKGILGQAEIVVGSRFHALVGALSQAVPCIGTSWSHKYQMLFGDFGGERFLLSAGASMQQIRDRVRELVDEPGRGAVVGRIREAAQRREGEVRRMWEEVERVLGVGSIMPAPAERTSAKAATEVAIG